MIFFQYQQLISTNFSIKVKLELVLRLIYFDPFIKILTKKNSWKQQFIGPLEIYIMFFLSSLGVLFKFYWFFLSVFVQCKVLRVLYID